MWWPDNTDNQSFHMPPSCRLTPLKSVDLTWLSRSLLKQEDAGSMDKRVVLITGCSSGIGLSLAVRLASDPDKKFKGNNRVRVWDDFCFVTWCVIKLEEAIRRGVWPWREATILIQAVALRQWGISFKGAHGVQRKHSLHSLDMLTQGILAQWIHGSERFLFSSDMSGTHRDLSDVRREHTTKAYCLVSAWFYSLRQYEWMLGKLHE